ncbi:MAG TPA: alpha/beta fold hydrolase [Paracoccaceae bacterium]|nr:alpha/beta fold hydrolase [Paracoccaceae bacterium]
MTAMMGRKARARAVTEPDTPPAPIAARAPWGVAAAPETWAEDPVDRMAHSAIAHLSGGFSPMGLAEAWFDWAIHLGVSPARQRELAFAGLAAAAHVGDLARRIASGQAECVPCAHSLPQDKRFKDPAWQRWPFALHAEAHLAIERWWDEATRNIHGASRHHLELLNFVGRQCLDIFAPSNFVATNPEVLRATYESAGINLARGFGHALEDLRRALLNEPAEGAEAYLPGHSVALTPGRVVHRTRLAEIIQYAPTTPEVRPEPIVIVPAWIMKYYILDLSPQNSLVRYLVEQGFTVFMISWKNPGIEDRDLGFDDYRTEGVMPALEAALAITGASKVHALGYCIGGTLLATSAALMAREGDDRIRALSFFAAQTDFEEAGELRLFIDESLLAILEDLVYARGVLEASRMAGSFHLLRSNDLIWSRMIRRYLLGTSETLSDVTAWAADATRMPGRMHSEYLRQFYLNNDLAEGRLLVDGRPVALQDVRVPIFALGTEWDHVAPWRSVFKLHLLADTDITFALTNGGHNQGVVSPPGRKDRHYRIGTQSSRDRYVDPDSWLQNAAYHDGSWWPAWIAWLNQHSGEPVPPPPLGRPEAGFPALEPAPGLYVHR